MPPLCLALSPPRLDRRVPGDRWSGGPGGNSKPPILSRAQPSAFSAGPSKACACRGRPSRARVWATPNISESPSRPKKRPNNQKTNMNNDTSFQQSADLQRRREQLDGLLSYVEARAQDVLRKHGRLHPALYHHLSRSPVPVYRALAGGVGPRAPGLPRRAIAPSDRLWGAKASGGAGSMSAKHKLKGQQLCKTEATTRTNPNSIAS